MNAEYYRLLKDFIAFKTVSGVEEYKQDCKNCINWLEDLFRQNDFQVKKIIKYGVPILIANYVANPDFETILIYGNYDTTFAQKKDGRKDEPFSLYLWKDEIIWKWTAEWKWILLLQILAVCNLIKENKLKYNVSFLIDGERYSWSNWIKTLLQESLFLQNEWLDADCVFASIWHLISGTPTINSWFRWWFNTTINLKVSNQKNNINHFGWLIVNPALEWAKLISKLYGLNHQISIPYFYYEVDEISANQKTINWRIPFDKEKILEYLGTKNLRMDEDMDFYSKSSYRPCIEVTWFHSGDITDTIPESATIDLSAKLVSNQKTASIQTLFEDWINKNIPNDIEYDVNFSCHSDPIKIQLQNIYAENAMKVLESVYGKKTIQISSWYTLPVAKLMQEKISANIINIPMVNDTCNIHSLMENVEIDKIEKWYQFMYEFLKK